MYAYHQAEHSKAREPLLYARVLSMMASESRFHYSDYDLYHLFEKPAVNTYEAAGASSLRPTDKELEMTPFSREIHERHQDIIVIPSHKNSPGILPGLFSGGIRKRQADTQADSQLFRQIQQNQSLFYKKVREIGFRRLPISLTCFIM